VKDLLYIDVSKTKYRHILFHIKMFHFYFILQELKIYEEDMTSKYVFGEDVVIVTILHGSQGTD